jgi:hypothetical protein
VSIEKAGGCDNPYGKFWLVRCWRRISHVIVDGVSGCENREIKRGRNKNRPELSIIF